jgi:glycosyltransferase involved in cell wall biosynthesis
MPANLPRYVLVTPARNEATFIEKTIQSVIAQTAPPVAWVIVSDGSTDGTDEIVSKYLPDHSWMQLVRLGRQEKRNFAGKAAAFNEGCARVAGLDYDVIGNLDGDVSFDNDYLAFLMQKFAEHPRLGVAGTPYREDNGRYDERFKSPEHVSGACQLFRRECFEAIGGYPLISTGGIDLIALFKAKAAGWETRRFDERYCHHHRAVGSGLHAGLVTRLLNHGRMDYLLGSHPLFEVFRCVLQMKNRPYVVGGVLMLIGYFYHWMRRTERSMPDELVAIRQIDQLRRLKAVLRHPLRHGGGFVPALAQQSDRVR